jgi:protein TonB
MLPSVAIQPVENPQEIYTFVQQQPSFPGGLPALYEFLGDNLEYPEKARENRVTGTVIVQFVVETDGSITDLYVARSVDPELDKEAIRVLSQMPLWIPGNQNGKNVRVRFTVPVKFTIVY